MSSLTSCLTFSETRHQPETISENMCVGPGSAIGTDLGHWEEDWSVLADICCLLFGSLSACGCSGPGPTPSSFPNWLASQLSCSLTLVWVRLAGDQQDTGGQEDWNQGTHVPAPSQRVPSRWLRPLIKGHRSTRQQSSDSWCLPEAGTTVSPVPLSPGQ